MRENPKNPQSGYNSFLLASAQADHKMYVWKPKNDIRISELAKCINFVSHPICHDISLISPECLRHFEVIDP